ncbi:hypothetical protein NQ314_020512 [Rhamnusium bicolor]|uniref:Uncharacterized protein n=1 Tax=Rhamnusium bicolor TaxID=1586634 RepID=A0AAV8WLF6_9CUCU|nr:hypothetical protein NQ314_020512 [Rhamnusium bicolor]
MDGILGANLFAHLLGDKRIVGPPNTPVAVETSLGFIVMDKALILSPAPILSSFCLTVEPSLENFVKRFWEVKDLPSSTTVDPDDLECEKIFQTTYRRDLSGRYTVVFFTFQN